MGENNVTTGVRSRVIGTTIENVRVKQPELSSKFLEELRELLAAEKVPKADVYLQLFEEQVGGDS
jgi:formamidopyrimidine-DNA glycosylase